MPESIALFSGTKYGKKGPSTDSFFQEEIGATSPGRCNSWTCRRREGSTWNSIKAEELEGVYGTTRDRLPNCGK
jgi:hypothetical protein